MIKFKKICTIALGIVLLAGTVLTGCHGKKRIADFDVPDEFDTSKQYNIVFWAKNDTNKTQANIYEKAISDFEKLYPNINVSIKMYTDYKTIYNDVITNISTNTTPNVCITYPDHIATYMTGANTVVPLDDLFADKDYGLGGKKLKFDSPKQKEIISKFLDEGVFNNYHYAIPFMRSTEACYINKTYVEKLGYTVPDVLTWDYIWEVSEASTNKNSDGTYAINGKKVMIPFIYKSTDNMMITMLKQLNAGYSKDTGEVLIFNETTKDILQTIAGHVKTGAFSTFAKSGYPANFLNAGQCIFAIDSTAGATWMGTDAPLCDISEDNIVSFETVVRPIPQYDADNMKMISQGPSICIFNKDDSGEVMASWLFAQYLLTNEVQVAYSQTEGYVPVTTKARESQEYKDYLSKAGEDNNKYYKVKIDTTRMLIENTDNTFVTPVFNGSASLRNAAGQMVEEVTKSVSRKKTVDDSFVSNLYANMTSLYRLDQIEVKGQENSKDLGPLPGGAVAILVILGVAWLLIAGYFAYSTIKSRLKK